MKTLDPMIQHRELTGVLTVYKNNGVFDYERLARYSALRSGVLFGLPHASIRTDSVGEWRRHFHGVEGEQSFFNDRQIDAMAETPFNVTIFHDADFLPVTQWLSIEAAGVNVNTPLKFLRAKHVVTEDLTSELRSDAVNPFPVWSTVLIYYLDQTPGSLTQRFFDEVRHVRDHWEFYAMQTGVSPKLYRNDFAFSIALRRLRVPVERVSLSDQYRCAFYFDVPCDSVTSSTVSMRGLQVPYDVHCMHKPSLLQVI